MAKYTLADFGQQFPDDDACLLYLFEKRYGQHGPVCTCGKRDSFHRVAGRKTFACAWCGTQISPTAGTIFDHSPTPLTLWFFAMFLMCSSRNGVAALELKRQLGVTYKTAWRMAHAIRRLMQVSRRYLPLYAAEQAWRYSRRRSTRPMLLSLLDQAAKVVPTARAA
jgi:transposase